MKTKLFPLIVGAALLLLLLNTRIEAGTGNSSSLLGMAMKKFDRDLSPAEENLFEKIERSGKVDYIPQKRHTIRADRVVWLCTDQNAAEFITYQGIQVSGACIPEELTLRHAKVPFPLSFIDCNFPRGINLENANVFALDLSGSSTGEILANGMEVKHCLLMKNGFTSNGKVSLNGAIIKGDLDCGGGHFNNPCRGGHFNDPNEAAFIADGLRVEQKVLMRRFRSDGMVRFNGATIGIALDCSEAVFSNPDGYALVANGLRVERSVYMPDGVIMAAFIAEGMVSLVDGTIDGILDCRNGYFRNPHGDAFIGTGLKILRSVHTENSTFEGQVRLASATIGGNLDFENGIFINPNGTALDATGIEVKGNVDMRGTQVRGNVDLSGAKIERNFIWTEVDCGGNVLLSLRGADIGTLQDDLNSWPPRLFICGLKYKDLYEESPRGASERIEWLNRQDQNRFLPQPYEQLATVLRNHGHDEEAKKILFEKNDARLRITFERMPFYLRCWNYLLKWTIGYGYYPWRIHLFGIPIVIIGSVLYFIGFQLKLIEAIEEFPVKAKSNKEFKFSSFFYSLDVFTPVIDLQQAAYWLPVQYGWPSYKKCRKECRDDRKKIFLFLDNIFLSLFSMILRWYLWFQIFSGWIFMALFITGLGGLVKM